MTEPTLNERALESEMAKLLIEAIEHNMTLEEILNVLERLRHLTTEMIVEIQNGSRAS